MHYFFVNRAFNFLFNFSLTNSGFDDILVLLFIMVTEKLIDTKHWLVRDTINYFLSFSKIEN